MGEPLKTQLFSTFLGVEEGIHSIILPEVFSSGGSLNLYLDKFGRARKVEGYLKANASAITTNGGGSATAIRGLAHYRSTSGGSTTSQIISVVDDGVNEWEVWKSGDGAATWTFVSDLGAGAVGMIPDFAQFGDNLYITNGKGPAKKWNGSALSTAGDSQSPTPTAAAGAAGSLSGVYQWKLVARKDDFSKKPGSLASAQLSITAKQGSLTWTADADTHVVGYEVYRTTGTGATYYFVDYVSGRTTAAFTDTTPDSTLINNPVLETHGDAPPTTYFVEPHKQRMWWGKSDTYPTRLWWSDPGLPESVYSFNYLEFSDSETQGDQITGMVGNFGTQLLVLTEEAVWTVSGTGGLIGNITDWNKQRSSAQTGCVTHRSVARVPVGARYMDQQGQLRQTASNSIAYFTPLGDIRLFDGENDEVISHPVKDSLSTFNTALTAKIHCLHDPTRAHFVWFFPTGDDTECTTGIAWNYRWGVWYKWSPLPFSTSLLVIGDQGDSPYLLTGEANTATGGFTYYYFVDGEGAYNGTPISAHWMTKTIYSRDAQGAQQPDKSAQWRWADFLFRTPAAATNLTIEWMGGTEDDEAVGVASKTISTTVSAIHPLGGIDSLLSASGDTIGVVGATTQARVLLHDPRGKYLNEEGIRLRIGNTTSDSGWALEAFTLAYQPHSGDYRRNQ